MSGSKIVDGSPDPFCPTCGDQAVLSEENDDGTTDHRCAKGHEWTVATDGGLPSCESPPRLKAASSSATDAIGIKSECGRGSAHQDSREGGS